MADINPQPLPLRRSEVFGGRPQRQEIILDHACRVALVQRARTERVPHAAILYAAFAMSVVERLSTSTVSVFINVPGRGLPGSSAASGAFYNTVPVRLPVDASNSSVSIRNVADALYEVLDHQDLPVALLSLAVEKRGGRPLASCIPWTLNVVDHPLAGFRIPGCHIIEIDPQSFEPRDWSSSTMLDGDAEPGHVDVLVSVRPEAIVLAIEHSDRDPDDVIAFLEEYAAVVCALTGASPSGRTGAPSLISKWPDL